MKSKKVTAMKKGGKLLSEIRSKATDKIQVGISLLEIDKYVEDLINKFNGKPSFKMVSGYQYATCINVNDGIVHGIPNKRIITDGDVVTIDIGIYFDGYHTDAATTVIVGKKNTSNESFLAAGRKSLENAIMQAKKGNRVADISKSIQDSIEASGYLCSQSLTGHGVGKELHEEPIVPCVISGEYKNSPVLVAGQTLAIEVIYTKGSPEMRLENDGWTFVTIDGENAAVFEDTILVTENEPINLTVMKE